MRSSVRNESKTERRVLTGMITDKDVLARIAPKWDKDLFRSKFSNIVGGWCVSYFNKYGKAPERHIEGLFETWATASKDKATVETIDEFLSGLSDEYASLRKAKNSEYVLDLASTHFNEVKASRHAEQVQGFVDSGNLDQAKKAINTYSDIQIASGDGIDVLTDHAAIQKAFEDKKEPLISYPGALGSFFGDVLERDGLVAFMGPEKRGKTWMLIDVAWVGMLQRRKVAFFEVGDMSQSQILRRFMTRASKRPLTARSVLYPRSLTHDLDEPFAEVVQEEREFTKPLHWKTAWKACQKILKVDLRSKHSYLKLFCYPNSSINILGIRDVLHQLERLDWTPDIVVLDYPDILAPYPGYMESRDQINATWKAMRAISQSYHCLFVTATQSDAASYEVMTLHRKHFADDKRKYAQVTDMIGLSQTEDEKKRGILRLNHLALREGAYSESHCVHVAGCLAIANPCILSTF